MSDVTESAYRLVRSTPVEAEPAPQLDAAQRAVVDHAGGPLLVLAGPGTGKTTTLVETVAARVATGTPVDRILMLTFSRRAANEMRDRVAARLGSTIREPIARTLHSYAFGILRLANRRDTSGDDPLPPPRLLSGPEQDVMVRDLLAGRGVGAWPAELRPAVGTLAFAGELRDLLLRAVERGLLGVDLAELGRRRRRPDWVAAGEFLTEYEQVTALAKPGAYDPAELIRSAVNSLHADPELLAAERARRRRIFVDEYQDTDPAQAELLSLLSAGSDELVLVGDPDQSIYAFRGADEAALREVDARFGGGGPVPVLALGVCRRSGPNLVAASRRVAARLPGGGEQRALTAARSGTDTVEVRLFASTSAEANHIAGRLRRAHLDGVPWSRMAVLMRSTSAVLSTVRRALLTAGVPVAVRGDDLPLSEQPAVAVLLELLHCVLDPALPADEAMAERLLLGPVGRADAVSLQRLRRAVTRLVTPGSAPLLAPLLRDEREARLLPEHLRWPVARVQTVLAAGRAALTAHAAGSAEEVLWAMWSASGLAARWSARSAAGGPGGAAADRDLDAVVALFDAAARFTDRLPRAGAAEFARHVADQQIPGDGYSGRGAEPDAVAILTAHAAKGLEWDFVCVAGVQEGRWPDLRMRGSLLGTDALVDAVAGVAAPTDPAHPQSATRLAEERRLFYVAVTRARSRLLVTAVRGEDEQPSRFLDELDPPGSSDLERPIAESDPPAHLAGLVALLRAVVTDGSAPATERNAAAGELARLAAAGVPGADPDEWWGMAPMSDTGAVADPRRPVPVSPSRIDSFLRCELRTVLQDLGAVDGQQLSASLGTLVHEVAATAPADASLTELQAMVDERWNALDFGARWFGANERARAGEILTRLVDWMRSSRGRLELVAVEEPFRVELGDAVLSGRVDRVERDEQGQLVVVDLKTGKTKVKSDELDEHPQLGAYQLAVAEGGFGAGEQAGGAVLVQLAVKAKDPEQWQPPLADRAWIDTAVAHVAARLRGSEFDARINSYCGHCDLQNVCPLQNGRQVTS